MQDILDAGCGVDCKVLVMVVVPALKNELEHLFLVEFVIKLVFGGSRFDDNLKGGDVATRGGVRTPGRGGDFCGEVVDFRVVGGDLRLLVLCFGW